MRRHRPSFLFLLSLILAAIVPATRAADSQGEKILESLGVHGGLCVQVGAEDVDAAGQLAALGQTSQASVRN